MYFGSFKTSGQVARQLAVAVSILLAGVAAVPAQMVDLNGNGMSDIWEWLYNAYGINPNTDPDGDLFSNIQEAQAGTNPFDSNSFPHITFSAFATNNFSVTLPCALGKQYQLQSIADLTGTNWTIETNVVARTGTNITLTATATATAKFYRVAIADVDTDGDGVNDWEEYQLGLDPTNPYSNGQQDANGKPLTDYQYVTGKISQQNVITIAASGPTAVQPSPGQNATAFGQFTITRGGFPLGAVPTVSLASGSPSLGLATSGLDYAGLPGSVTIAAGASSQTIALTPLANPNRQAPVLAQLSLKSGANYTIGTQNSASVVIYPSPAATGTGLLGQYFTNSSKTYTNANNFNPTNLILARIDPVVNFDWTNGTSPDLSNGLYSVRWIGQVQPQFSDTYMFVIQSDDGCKLWVNDQLLINKWQSQVLTTWTNSIALQAGTRYDIRLEYLQNGGGAQVYLSWYSPDQPEQIIPATCLYPTNTFASATNAASVVTSPLSAVAFLGQPFSFAVTAANTPLGFTASGLPPGLSFNNASGLISGVPMLAGNFMVSLTSSNNAGVGASALDITVLNTGSSVVQEIWTNAPGINITDIPISTPANITNVLGGLQGVTGYGQNYGERIRGYFTPPVTGNYYFWIAGSDSAQLWISDDSNQVNEVLRAWVNPTPNPLAPPEYGTAPQQWNLQTNQQSAWLALVAGQPYYIEILHKAGVDTNDNWSVAWLQDPTGTNTTPAGLVPSYLLSRYYPPLPVTLAGTLYSANLLALPGVTSDGVGSATLLVNAAGTQATLNFQISNLKGTATGESINSDPYLNDPGELIYDISAAKPQANGSYLWTIQATARWRSRTSWKSSPKARLPS